jgi:hypothetical protein
VGLPHNLPSRRHGAIRRRDDERRGAVEVAAPAVTTAAIEDLAYAAATLPCDRWMRS